MINLSSFLLCSLANSLAAAPVALPCESISSATALSWTLVTPVTPTVGAMIETQTIGALIPNTEYHFRVDTTCHFGSCYSVTISVTTKI